MRNVSIDSRIYILYNYIIRARFVTIVHQTKILNQSNFSDSFYVLYALT